MIRDKIIFIVLIATIPLTLCTSPAHADWQNEFIHYSGASEIPACQSAMESASADYYHHYIVAEEYATYCDIAFLGDTDICDAGFIWDNASQACIEDEQEPEPEPEITYDPHIPLIVLESSVFSLIGAISALAFIRATGNMG